MFSKIFKKTILSLSALAVLSCSTVFANPIVVDYYYGDGCSFCAKIEPMLKEYESQHKEDVKINWYEIWKNEDNNKRFQEEMGKFEVPSDERGTPSAVVNNKVLVGSKDIADQLAKEVENAKNNPNKEIVKFVSEKPQQVPNKLPQVNDQKFSQEDKDAYCYNKLTKNLNLGIIGFLLVTTLGSFLYIIYNINRKLEKENKE